MTVTRIDSVELYQNAIERLFHTGHVCIKGHTEIEFLNDYSSYYTEKVDAPDRHVLYGIKDFESFCQKICDCVDPSVVRNYKS